MIIIDLGNTYSKIAFYDYLRNKIVKKGISNKLEIFVFPKQIEDNSNALIEIDLSAGTDNLPLRHLLFNDLRVNVFFIIN